MTVRRVPRVETYVDRIGTEYGYKSEVGDSRVQGEAGIKHKSVTGRVQGRAIVAGLRHNLGASPKNTVTCVGVYLRDARKLLISGGIISSSLHCWWKSWLCVH